MRKATICAGLLALCMAWSASAAEVRAMSYQVGADVDAQGKITATQFDANVPAGIASVLTAAMKQWQFTPAKRDGRAVPAHTFVRVRLKATPDANGQYALRVRFIGNGPRLKKAVAPRFPANGIRTSDSNFVLLEARVQADGSLSDLSASGESTSPRTLRGFKQNVLEAARQWRYFPETVDGQPVATRIRIPFYFDLKPEPSSTSGVDDDDTAPSAPLARKGEVALDSPLQPQSVADVVSAP